MWQSRFLAVIVSLHCFCSCGAEQPPVSDVKAESSPTIARSQAMPFIDWLPKETESLTVIRELYEIPQVPELDGKKDFARFAQDGFLEFAFRTKHIEPLVGKTVKLWIEGACRFQVPADRVWFENIDTHECQILVFAEPQSDAFRKLVSNLLVHSGGKRIRIHDFEVLHFKASHLRGYKPPPSFWLSTPLPDVLLVATKMEFLRDILGKVKQPVAEAFPAESREWRDIRPDARVWGMRRFAETVRLTDFSDARFFDRQNRLAESSGFTFQMKPEDLGAEVIWRDCDELMQERLRERLWRSPNNVTVTLPGSPKGTVRMDFDWFRGTLATDVLSRSHLQNDAAGWLRWNLGHAWTFHSSSRNP